MQLQYNCSKCGTPMTFDAATAKFICKECNTKEDIKGYVQDFPGFSSKTIVDTFDDEEARQYVCRNCNATLITDNHTALEKCFFCGNPMRLGERMSGDLAPTKVIPFTISKEKALRTYHKWRRNLIFSPREYIKSKYKREMIGVYIPFWLYNIKVQGEASLHAVSVKTFKENKEKVTQTSEYNLYRQIDLSFENIPRTASKMFTQNQLEGILPYDYNTLKTFQLRDLANHYSEQYNTTSDTSLNDAINAADSLTNEFLMQSGRKYENVTIDHKDCDTRMLSSEYALMPVWIVRYDYRDKEYTFLMNGQTGKVAGNPPLSPVKLAVSFGLIAAFTFIFCRVLTVLLGGPLL